MHEIDEKQTKAKWIKTQQIETTSRKMWQLEKNKQKNKASQNEAERSSTERNRAKRSKAKKRESN